MKQTAVKWLLEQWPILETQLPQWLIEQAKEMEKEQIKKERVEAYNNGYANGQNDAYAI